MIYQNVFWPVLVLMVISRTKTWSKICQTYGPIFRPGDTLAKVIKGRSLTVFPKVSRPSWTKMSEISIKTVENIDEIDQIILLTTCTTKLHRYYRVTLHFLDFHQKNFPEIPPPPFYYHPFYYLHESNCLSVFNKENTANKPHFSILRNKYLFDLRLTWQV